MYGIPNSHPAARGSPPKGHLFGKSLGKGVSQKPPVKLKAELTLTSHSDPRRHPKLPGQPPCVPGLGKAGTGLLSSLSCLPGLSLCTAHEGPFPPLAPRHLLLVAGRGRVPSRNESPRPCSQGASLSPVALCTWGRPRRATRCRQTVGRRDRPCPTP